MDADAAGGILRDGENALCTDDPENPEKQKGVKSTSTDLVNFEKSQGL